MKRAHSLAPAVLLITGAFYLRALASWRPQKVFSGHHEIWRLAFSGNDNTLLVGQRGKPGESFQITALDVGHGFISRWSHQYFYHYKLSEEIDYLGKPQFFAFNSHILLNSYRTFTLDAGSGKILWNYGLRGRAVMSPDGKWLANNIEYKTDGRGASSYRKTMVCLHSVGIQQRVDIARPNQDTSALSFAFSPNGKTFAVAVSEGAHKHKIT